MLMIDPWVPADFLKIGANFGPKSKGCKKAGIDYEQRVSRQLREFVTANMPGWRLLCGPWYRNLKTRRCRQPDAVLIHDESNTGIVVEVKLNWKDGRDEKLLDVYLPIVKTAHKLDCVWPILITRCTRGYPHPVFLKLSDLDRCQSWLPGDPTPMMLVI